MQQLNLKLPPEVAAHWSAQARAEGLSVRDWLIARVGPAAGPAPAAGAELLERVAALEAAVGELQRRPASPERVNPAALSGDALPQRRLTPSEAAGLLTTPQVGEALGLSSDSALTNWIAREASKRGGSAVGGIYRGHRLRGKGLLPGGQKPGWLWEPIEA
jgi:hypothetical protein